MKYQLVLQWSASSKKTMMPLCHERCLSIALRENAMSMEGLWQAMNIFITAMITQRRQVQSDEGALDQIMREAFASARAGTVTNCEGDTFTYLATNGLASGFEVAKVARSKFAARSTNIDLQPMEH